MKPSDGDLRIVHVITSLGLGGAEVMLLRLLEELNTLAVNTLVISLGKEDVVADRIRKLGIRVESLAINPSIPSPIAFLRMIRMLRDFRADIVQTWMYHADFLGGLAAYFAGKIPLVWGIHNSSLNSKSKPATRLIRFLSALLSGILPKRIISVSQNAKEIHADLGYASDLMVVIPNGFIIPELQKGAKNKVQLMKELAIPKSAFIVTQIARFHPQKDHQNFVRAAEKAAAVNADIHFVLCGEGITRENDQLLGWIEQARLSERFHLLGRRDDIPSILSVTDICTLSSSFGEAFPLVLGEAMAAGVLCVATDVGDSAYLLGGYGRIVPPKDPQSLAEAWLEILGMPPKARAALGEKARARILTEFPIEKIAEQYLKLYEEVLGRAILA